MKIKTFIVVVLAILVALVFSIIYFRFQSTNKGSNGVNYVNEYSNKWSKNHINNYIIYLARSVNPPLGSSSNICQQILQVKNENIDHVIFDDCQGMPGLAVKDIYSKIQGEFSSQEYLYLQSYNNQNSNGENLDFLVFHSMCGPSNNTYYQISLSIDNNLGFPKTYEFTPLDKAWDQVLLQTIGVAPTCKQGYDVLPMVKVTKLTIISN